MSSQARANAVRSRSESGEAEAKTNVSCSRDLHAANARRVAAQMPKCKMETDAPHAYRCVPRESGGLCETQTGVQLAAGSKCRIFGFRAATCNNTPYATARCRSFVLRTVKAPIDP